MEGTMDPRKQRDNGNYNKGDKDNNTRDSDGKKPLLTPGTPEWDAFRRWIVNGMPAIPHEFLVSEKEE